MEQQKHGLLIQGVTDSGQRFRPSDWAQRLSTAVASTTRDGRIRFHPKVCMLVENGVNCVWVDGSLEDEDPRLYRFLVNFARDNHLAMSEKDRAA